jgi:hypothetical protein
MKINVILSDSASTELYRRIIIKRTSIHPDESGLLSETENIKYSQE